MLFHRGGAGGRGVEQADRSAPPSCSRMNGMGGIRSFGLSAQHTGQRGWPGLAAADVEGAGLVTALCCQQGVPALAAEQRPAGDGAYVDALSPHLACRRPGIQPPAYLLFPRAAIMHLRDRERNTIAVPRLAQRAPK